MIEIKNLTKNFGNIKALEDVSFTVNKGEILGFLGPNGAGKTTAMNIITGFIPSTSGTVTIDGFDIMDSPKEAKRKIGYLPEQPPLYMDMTVKEYLNFICDLKSVPRAKRKSQIDDIMYLVKIGDKRDRLIKNLSKGYKQRVGLSQALVGNPEVLILDEPTVGLDPKQIIEIRKLISALGKEHTIILSSHILPEVSAVCSNIVIINNGKIVIKGTSDSFSSATNLVTKFTVSVDGPVNNVQNLLRSLDDVSYVEHLRSEKDISTFLIESIADIDARRSTFFGLAKAGYAILELKPMGTSLEEVFLSVISKETQIKED